MKKQTHEEVNGAQHLLYVYIKKQILTIYKQCNFLPGSAPAENVKEYRDFVSLVASLFISKLYSQTPGRFPTIVPLRKMKIPRKGNNHSGFSLEKRRATMFEMVCR